MLKVKAKVLCEFEIEYEDDNLDINYTKENIEMSYLKELVGLETDESIQIVQVSEINKI